MVTKKVRTEYMKKFREPKWETFSKCYEDSVKYRLTRRVMEHSHKPWFWEGWDGASDSSGWSTPRLARNRVAPLSVAPVKHKLLELRGGPAPGPPSEEAAAAAAVQPDGGEAADASSPAGDVTENGVREDGGGGGGGSPLHVGASEDTTTDNGPADSPSSDRGPPPNPVQRRRRRRATRSEPEQRDSSHDDRPPSTRKPPRAKSQPPSSGKDQRWSSGRLDWRSANDSHTSDACVQTRREWAKRGGGGGGTPDRRRARSADLEKTRRSQLVAVEDRWVTEYMRCFSARLR